MNLAGRTDLTNTTPGPGFDADTKKVSRYNLPRAMLISKASVYLDGLGGRGLGPQVCRYVIYSPTDVLLAVSDEVTVAVGQQPDWVDFRFSAYGSTLAMPVGDFFGGLICGGYTDTIRLYFSTAAHGMGGKGANDAYADGPSATFGAATPTPNDFASFLTYYLTNASFLPDETDMYFSRLPFVPSQRIFGNGGPEKGSTRLVDVGWHDTFIDPETGANALVRDGSDLADMLLGQRIKVSTQGVAQPRTVYAYVSNLADTDALDWDLSLTRHLYSQIALLAQTTVSTVVQVVA